MDTWFIANLVEIELPSVKLLRKSVTWNWGEQQLAFEILKEALTKAPVIARPAFSLPFSVQSDASEGAVGAVLSQEHADGEHPVVFVSPVITDKSSHRWLRDLRDPTGRLARSTLQLQEWNSDVIHRTGAPHYIPDAPYRIYESEEVAAAIRKSEKEDDWYKWRLRMCKISLRSFQNR